jgi:hypothetical protein
MQAPWVDRPDTPVTIAFQGVVAKLMASAGCGMRGTAGTPQRIPRLVGGAAASFAVAILLAQRAGGVALITSLFRVG